MLNSNKIIIIVLTLLYVFYGTNVVIAVELLL